MSEDDIVLYRNIIGQPFSACVACITDTMLLLGITFFLYFLKLLVDNGYLQATVIIINHHCTVSLVVDYCLTVALLVSFSFHWEFKLPGFNCSRRFRVAYS